MNLRPRHRYQISYLGLFQNRLPAKALCECHCAICNLTNQSDGELYLIERRCWVRTSFGSEEQEEKGTANEHAGIIFLTAGQLQDRLRETYLFTPFSVPTTIERAKNNWREYLIPYHLSMHRSKFLGGRTRGRRYRLVCCLRLQI